MEVEDCMSSDGGEDYYCSDRDSLDDALENEDSDSQWAPPKGSSSKSCGLMVSFSLEVWLGWGFAFTFFLWLF
ncbi:hypothetical protein OSB04_015802 [Centaurea solstitialis]|uniref:Uncharacterized protein n=1 Tax=Centaurea solstitialis TaxID=347529 RepID=A0AA38THY3_9ASTR|nr:hypothetical protein OSB04_015802 [Centaurea solstitialis]